MGTPLVGLRCQPGAPEFARLSEEEREGVLEGRRLQKAFRDFDRTALTSTAVDPYISHLHNKGFKVSKFKPEPDLLNVIL